MKSGNNQHLIARLLLKLNRVLLPILLTGAVLNALHAVRAATWTGGTATDWNDPSNWDTGTVPSGTEPIVIPFGTPAVPEGMMFSDLTISGGTVTGTFTVTGKFEWSGGTLKDGTTTIGSGATLTLTGNFGKELNGHRIVSRGTIEWVGQGLVNAHNGSELRSEPEGTLELNAPRDSGFRELVGAPSRLVNAGKMRKSAADVVFNVQAPFEHLGAMELAGGELRLSKGGLLAGNVAAGEFARFSLADGDFIVHGDLELENTTLARGTFGGTNTLSGEIVWAGGTLKRAQMTIAEGSTLMLEGSSGKGMDAATLSNAGTILWNGSGVLNADRGSVLNNSGRIEIRTQRSAQVRTLSEPVAVINNSGLLLKAGSRDTFDFRAAINNSGEVQVESGELKFSAGGTISGKWNAQDGTFLRLTDGRFTLEEEIEADTLELGGGEFVGTHLLRGRFVWSGGTLASGTTVIDPEATLQVEGGTTKILDAHQLENRGRIIWVGSGTVVGNNGSVIRNVAGANLTLRTDRGHSFRSDRGSIPLLENAGTVQKTGPDVETHMSFNFRNSGELIASSGMLRFHEEFTQADGETRLDGGDLQIRNGMNLDGGILHGNGTVQGSVINSAMVSPGADTGLLTIEGDFTQNNSGTLLLHIGGLNPVTEHDRLDVTGRASFAGKIIPVFVASFTPIVGNRFEVMSYRSHSGSAILEDVTQAMEAEFGQTTLTLVTEREPIILEPFSLLISGVPDLDFRIVIEGQPDIPYVIQGSTDLQNWEDLHSASSPEGTVEFVDMPAENLLHRFYRAAVVLDAR